MSSSSLQNQLGENEVFELVVDYLRTRQFYDAEKTLIREREKTARQNPAMYLKDEDSASKSESKRCVVSLNQGTASRLESLLERSYVTSLVSGSPSQMNRKSKKRRVHLDGNFSMEEHDVKNEKKKDLSVATKLVSYNPCKDDPHGSATMPIYQTSTFAQNSATDFGEYDYTRSGNPTRTAFEKQMAELEYGYRGFAFTSGMAALSAVSQLVSMGDEIILSDDSYGGTYRLLSKISSKNGVNVKYVDLSGEKGPENLAQAVTTKTKLVMMESPTNPMLRVCDIRGLSVVAHQHGILLSVDNTMMSPVLQNPILLGADIVVHSATKFVCGHSDTMSGVIVAKDRELCDRIYFIQNAEGTGLSPFDCWLLLRGVKTMAIRVLKAQENAMRLAQFLRDHPAVSKVYYNGLPDSSKSNLLHYTQAKGSGSVICFQTNDLEYSRHIVSVTKLFKVTVSFGSVNSLISLPGAMSHASIPEDIRKKRSFPEDLIRLSIGIEDVQDLIDDLTLAFQTYEKKQE